MARTDRPSSTPKHAAYRLGRRKLVALLLGAAAALAPGLYGRSAQAQASTQVWPLRPVQIVCPIAAGGGIDATARVLAARLSEIWRQQVVVENKTGASGNIAAELVARSPPDGHTIYIATFSHATNVHLYPAIGYDPVADFAPVTLIGMYPNIMVVPNSSPARTVMEFVAYARSNRLSYASAGHGTSLHLAGELFKRRAGIEMTHVPYRGSSPAFNDLIPGRVDALFNFTSSSLPLVRAGQLRALAVTTAERVPAAPTIPTDGGGGRRRRGGVVLVGILPAGRDPARDRRENPRRHGRRAPGAGYSLEARGRRHRADRLHPAGAGGIPARGAGQVGRRDQSGEYQGGVIRAWIHGGFMRRRELIRAFGVAAAAGITRSHTARAQQPQPFRVGYLGLASAAAQADRLEALRAGLRDLGHVEGKSFVIDYRWADGRYDRLDELAAELVRANADVIVTHGTPGVLAAKRADRDDPDRHCDGGRRRGLRPRDEHRAAGRQRDRNDLLPSGAGRQAARARQGGRADRHQGRRPAQPGQSDERARFCRR